MSDQPADGLSGLTDEQLFAELRAITNESRNHPHSYDRARAQAIGAECRRRGWWTDETFAKKPKVAQ